MRPKIFFIHTPKCGGHSIMKCFKELNIDIVFTTELTCEVSTIELLKGDRNFVLFGHVNYIQFPRNQNEIKIFKEIMLIIYSHFNLIMPTRNPANLLQSWMHYSKTRVNKMLRDPTFRKTGEVSGKELAMFLRMPCLKQNTVRIVNHEISIKSEGSQTPVVVLEEKDEESNLLAFAEHTKTNNQWQVLNTMFFQLYYYKWKSVERAMVKGVPFSFNPPRSDKHRFVHYYDCEHSSNLTLDVFDQVIHPLFGKRLINARENSSENKPMMKASNISTVVQRLKEIAPNEWDIYNQSHSFEV